tara:strand:+ start:319 stop:1290 length:972 start_codon:yes stop_codon:yes gene_type:complete
MKFDELYKDIQDIYTEAKEAPKGKHYTKRGALRSGDADADGDGGPKYRSDPTYKNPNENAERKKRTPEQQAEIDKKIAQFKKNSEEFAKENPFTFGGGPSHASPAPRRQPKEDNETAKRIAKGTAKLAGKAANTGTGAATTTTLAFADYITDGDVSKGIDFVKTAYSGEDGEVSESLADHFMRFASKVSAAEQGRDVDIDELRIELNALDERLEALSSEESEETFDQLYSRYVTMGEEDAEEDAERVDKDRMKCNSPRRTSGGSKKFVVKACKDGKEKIVRYGDPNMKIKKSNPKRRKSFRARHKCDQKKDKFSAGYWSCKKW